MIFQFHNNQKIRQVKNKQTSTNIQTNKQTNKHNQQTNKHKQTGTATVQIIRSISPWSGSSSWDRRF